MWQMRMYEEIGKAAHHSGWEHGVCTGHIYVYKIYRHTHPDCTNYVFGRDRCLSSIPRHTIQQELSQAHGVPWVHICMQAAQVEVVPCWSEMDTTFKSQKTCIKGQLCLLHAEKRNHKKTNVTPSVSSHCVAALTILGNLSFPVLLYSFGSGGGGRTRIVYGVHHALRWHHDVLSYLFFSYILHFGLFFDCQ